MAPPIAEFEQAVLLAINPEADQMVRQNAMTFLENLKTDPDLMQFCMDQFSKNARQEVRFWCLQALQELLQQSYAHFDDSLRSQLRTTIFMWMTDLVVAIADPPYIKNKYSQILVLLVKRDFPERWPSFFTDILSLIEKNEHFVDMFSRVMEAVDSEIVSFDYSKSDDDAKRTTLIKDAMRELCIPQIVEAWYSILVHYCAAGSPVAKVCLSSISGYIGWIDITLVANERFVPLLFGSLTLEQYREEACECIFQIISKKMDPVAKVQLIAGLDLGKQLSNPQIDTAEGSDFSVGVSKLANGAGLELLFAHDKLRGADGVPAEVVNMTWAELDKMLPVIGYYLGHDDEETSLNCSTFVSKYLQTIKQLNLPPEQFNQQLHSFLNIVGNRIKYVEDYNFDKPEEYEVDFLQYRQNLTTIFKNIARFAPALALDFTQNAVKSACPNLLNLPFHDAEGALQLLFQLGEGVGDANFKAIQPQIAELVLLIAKADALSHPHWVVGLTFFDIIQRYAKLIASPDVLAELMPAFLDHRGIRHSNPTRRARCCYFFRRTVKFVHSSLFQLLPQLVDGIQQCLALSGQGGEFNLAPEDQLQLYEACGLLLTIDQLPADNQMTYVQGLLRGLFAEIEKLCNMPWPENSADLPEMKWLCHYVFALGCFSKSFTPRGQPQACQAFFPTLDIATSLVRLPSNEELRRKILFILHRMVETLGTGILPRLSQIIPELMREQEPKALSETTTLLNQVVGRFKAECRGFVDPVFQPVVDRMRHIIAAQESRNLPAQGEEARELFELKQSLCMFYNGIANSGLADVFLSETNAPHLNQTIDYLLAGVGQMGYVGIQKVSLGTLRNLCKEWVGRQGLEFFNSVCLERLVPILFQVVVHEQFDGEDAQTDALLREICMVHKLLWDKFGDAYRNFACTVITQVGGDMAAAQHFGQSIASVKDGISFYPIMRTLVKKKFRVV